MSQTEMYFGCPQPGVSDRPWASNITTLSDLAKLFESVENLTSVRTAAMRQVFRDAMINLSPVPGTSYSSPITGRTVGPLSNEMLRPIVLREAGAAKAAIVPDFIKHVVVRGKGGSGGPTGDEIGESDFVELTLPFKESGGIVVRKFLAGWYLCQSRVAGDPIIQKLQQEIHTIPIRLALATW